MIHKFISNDNQGNVNTLEIGSDYTKISKVVDPVDDDDVANKKYVDQAGGKFIVTLTPTSPDFSGTMDKTVAQINEAYEAGQEILFYVRVAGNVTLRSTMTEVYINTEYDFPSFQANVMTDSATLMKAYTGITDDGTKQTYQTMVYGV